MNRLSSAQTCFVVVSSSRKRPLQAEGQQRDKPEVFVVLGVRPALWLGWSHCFVHPGSHRRKAENLASLKICRKIVRFLQPKHGVG